jgi:GTPase SAR1 family protein
MIYMITGHKSSGKTSFIYKFINNNTILTYCLHDIIIYSNVEIDGYLDNIILEIPEDFFINNKCKCNCNHINTLIKMCNGILIFQDIRKKFYKNDIIHLYNILINKNPYVKICVVCNKIDIVDIDIYDYNINIITSLTTFYRCYISVLNNINISIPFKYINTI